MPSPAPLLDWPDRKRRRKPAAIAAPRPLESALHTAVANTLRDYAKPNVQWTHFPAGEHRNKITGARLKRMGLRRGWPDFILLVPRRAAAGADFHALELKRPGEDLTDDQRALAEWCREHGVSHAVARSTAEALAALDAMGVLRIRLNGVAA